MSRSKKRDAWFIDVSKFLRLKFLCDRRWAQLSEEIDIETLSIVRESNNQYDGIFCYSERTIVNLMSSHEDLSNHDYNIQCFPFLLLSSFTSFSSSSSVLVTSILARLKP